MESFCTQIYVESSPTSTTCPLYMVVSTSFYRHLLPKREDNSSEQEGSVMASFSASTWKFKRGLSNRLFAVVDETLDVNVNIVL